MVRIGNFLFHYRNGLFPLGYLLLFWKSPPVLPSDSGALLIGSVIASLGQVFRGVTIGLAYIRRGGRNRRVYADDLVTDGMFSCCRNPLYAGNLLILLGLGFVANSALFLTVGMLFFIFAYRAIIAAEEAFLRNKFGFRYDVYCQKVNRLVPNFAGFGDVWRNSKYNWKRLIVKEYGSSFVWISAAFLLVGRNWRWHHSYSKTKAFPWLLVGLWGICFLAFVLARLLKKRRFIEG